MNRPRFFGRLFSCIHLGTERRNFFHHFCMIDAMLITTLLNKTNAAPGGFSFKNGKA